MLASDLQLVADDWDQEVAAFTDLSPERVIVPSRARGPVAAVHLHHARLGVPRPSICPRLVLSRASDLIVQATERICRVAPTRCQPGVPVPPGQTAMFSKVTATSNGRAPAPHG